MWHILLAAGPTRECSLLESVRYCADLLNIETVCRRLVKHTSCPWCTGKTAVHVAAVSSGDVHPYPLVNNTERWTALHDSCPYPFTILGQNETWTGDKSVTNNKLFFYMKCAQISVAALVASQVHVISRLGC